MPNVVAENRYYVICRMDDDPYKAVIIAKGSQCSPLLMIVDVQEQIGNLSGSVVFDLTLMNGMSKTRYVEAQIEDGQFVKNSFQTRKDVPDTVKSVSSKWFAENNDLVRVSHLSSHTKMLLSHGAIL